MKFKLSCVLGVARFIYRRPGIERS